MAERAEDEEKLIQASEQWWIEAEPMSNSLPANIEHVKTLTPAEAFAFVELAIGEGTWCYKGRRTPNGWRLEPRVGIFMSEREHMKAWANKLGVVARDFKRTMTKHVEIDKLKYASKKPLYVFWKTGTRLLKIFEIALTVPFARDILDTFPKFKVMVELGSWVVTPEKKVRVHYSLIAPERVEELRKLRKQAIRVVPIPSTVVRNLTDEEKTEIVRLREHGMTVIEISETMNIKPSTIYKVLERTKRFF